MRSTIILLPLLSGVAACNSSPSVQATNASGSEVADKVAASGISDQLISPGQWQMTMTINDMSIPGLPPQAAAKMKAMLGQPKSFTECITPEEAKRPREKMFSGDDKSCRYDNFTMGGGKIDITMHCNGEGAARRMTMSGTYDPDDYHMTVSSVNEGKAGPGGMSMQMEMTGKRIGECTAAQKEQKERAKGG